MRIGLVGLGRMGAGISERLRQGGHEVVGYDADPDLSPLRSLADLVAALEGPPRLVWVMVPAGKPTESVCAELRELLAPGDLVIEGGNSYFKSSQSQAAAFAEHGIEFLDVGVSGGVWGATEGFCLMVGGEASQVARAQPIFDVLAPEGGFVHAGPVGAGHFTKMVHNGVEYGLMQAYGEGYELLAASPLAIDVEGAIKAWRHGSVVRSWLLELLARSLEADPGLVSLRGYAADSGEGRWTVEQSVELGVPMPVIAASLYARFTSRQDDPPAMKVVAALRKQFGGHPVLRSEGR